MYQRPLRRQQIDAVNDAADKAFLELEPSVFEIQLALLNHLDQLAVEIRHHVFRDVMNQVGNSIYSAADKRFGFYGDSGEEEASHAD